MSVPNWILNLMEFDPYISIASVVVNTFHLLVLCQKSMRISSTNSIMIGIAITIIFWMYKSIDILFIPPYNPGVCWIPRSYFNELLNWLGFALQDLFKRCDALLGISLGLIRVIALKYPGKFESISETSFGWKTCLFVYFLSSLLSSCNIQRTTVRADLIPWTPSDEACIGLFPENYTQPNNFILPNENGIYGGFIENTTFLFLDTFVSKITPCIMYPILTIVLISQVRKFEKNREKLFSNRTQIQHNSTTRAILCITIAYVIAQLPMGLLYMKQSFCVDNDCYFEADAWMYVTFIPSTLTTITHMPICLVLSSQYRQAFKSIFKFWRKNEVVPEQPESTVNSSPGTNGKN